MTKSVAGRVIGGALAASLPLAGLVSAASPSSAAPSPSDAPIAWVEVEDGVLSGGPAFNSGEHSNFSGTGSYTFRETGMSSTMTVDAPEAGTYPIYVRYAAGWLSAEEDVTRSMGLLTNGGSRQQMTLPITSTLADEPVEGHWENWEFWSGSVSLNKGENTVALQCDRSVDFCRLNFDAIQVGGSAPDLCLATPADEGYTALFDGTFASFDDWRKAGNGGFGRQNDCYIQNYRGRGAEWLKEQLASPYLLKLDWQTPASDRRSSVYVASSSRAGTDPVGGFRIPIGTPSGGDTGAIIPTGGTQQPADGAAVASALRPVGEWNTYLIQVTPSALRVYLNGTLVNTLTSATDLPVDGYIGLENNASGPVRFKEIQVLPAATATSTTTLSASPAAVTVKTGRAAVSVSVDAGGTPATGQVEISAGGATATTVTLVDGKARATLAPFTGTGTKAITARYLGSDIVEPSTASTTVAVRKAASTLTASVQPRKIVAKRTKATLQVGVRARGITPAGTVTVTVGSTTMTARLVHGRAVFRLPKFAKAGTVRATVTYHGDASTTAVRAAVTIKVVKNKAAKNKKKRR
jgi:hypothetical protein